MQAIIGAVIASICYFLGALYEIEIAPNFVGPWARAVGPFVMISLVCAGFISLIAGVAAYMSDETFFKVPKLPKILKKRGEK